MGRDQTNDRGRKTQNPFWGLLTKRIHRHSTGATQSEWNLCDRSEKEGLAVTYRRFQYEMRRKPDINTDGWQ